MTFQRNWIIKKEVFVVILFPLGWSSIENGLKFKKKEVLQSVMLQGRHTLELIKFYAVWMSHSVCFEGTALETVMRSKCKSEEKNLHSQHVCLFTCFYFNSLPLFMADKAFGIHINARYIRINIL